ncbi:MAG: DUF5050 domain-containing protein [Ruminococcaceae bacterium]|nr:DUF5050 domain-containing protein [Oscillospiraceae bacterium]
MKFDLSCPVQLVSAHINTETQTAEATFLNLSPQTITAISYEIILFDENGEIISKVPAEQTDISFPARETFTTVIPTENAQSVDIIFIQFTFEDGTVFTPLGEMVEISFDELSQTDKAHFKRAGISDAKCYAKEEESYWLCVCSRPNHKSSENCIRCNRSKEDVLTNYSNEHSLASAVLKKEELDAAKAEQIAMESARIAAEKKALLIKRAKKSGIIAGISVAAIAVLILIFSLVTMLIGDLYASDRNYKKAATMYSLSIFDKTDKIADRLYGNTPSNLMQMGIIAQDDENVYYLDAYYGISVQNKATGQKTKTEFSGLCLNASGGSLYFINVEDNYKIYKMAPDGSKCEAVYDSPVYYFTTVGNDIYFISDKIEQNDENKEEDTLSEKEKTETPLYVLKEGEKEPTFVSDVTMSTFTIYKNKIYYVDYSDNSSLYSMSLSGKGAKKIIKTPVYNFDIKNNKIYFTDGTVPSDTSTGIPKLTLEVANLNGRGRKTLVENAVVKSFNIANDAIYYMDNNTQGVLYKYTSDSEPKTEAEEVYLANASGDFVYYLTYDGNMHLTKLDKSGYEIVSSLEDAPSEENTQAPQE